MKKAAKLFGTSGIRGIFSPDTIDQPENDFVTGNLVTPELAWLLGLAVADLHQKEKNSYPVEVWRDVRDSGAILVHTLIAGLKAGGVDVIFRGIAPTTMYSMRPGIWAIVVTASHNPIEFNGFKVFRDCRPIIRGQEILLENMIHQWSIAPVVPFDPQQINAMTLMNSTDSFDLQVRHYCQTETVAKLKERFHSTFVKCFLPLDLAYGAAACPCDSSGKITEFSPQMAVLLSQGFPIIGYGCYQDSTKTNDRIGAAYAYGETSEQPEPHELPAFSNGHGGYGVGTQRILFWPVAENEAPSAIRQWADWPDLLGAYYTIRNNASSSRATVLVIHMDNEGTPTKLKEAIEKELAQRIALPGFMVDCDADRILVTTPALAATAIPFLTGDGMIRFFAETMPPETFTEIGFTVESGLSLDIALDKLAEKHKQQGFKPFGIRKVTVGDRALIDCFLDSGPGNRMGGEPSGHIIFSSTDDSSTILVDDPIITYLNLLDRVMDQGGNLDHILDQFYTVVPEVFCARKPDSRAGKGLSLTEKNHLELWTNGEWGNLSQYAKVFIPEYVSLYSEMVGAMFLWGDLEQILITDQWESLQSGDLEMPATGWLMPLSDIVFTGSQRIKAYLYLDPRPWAGPEVIRIVFRSITPEGRGLLIGEGVFRNSGTSPKNAGYHKLWPENPWTRETISEELLAETLTRLAALRAEFTNRYVETYLR